MSSAQCRAPGIRAPGISRPRGGRALHSLVEPLGACLAPAFFLVPGFRFLRPAAPGAASAASAGFRLSSEPMSASLSTKAEQRGGRRRGVVRQSSEGSNRYSGGQPEREDTHGLSGRPEWSSGRCPVAKYRKYNTTSSQDHPTSGKEEAALGTRTHTIYAVRRVKG